MHPLLFSFGPVHMYWLSVMTVIAWLVFSFLFWRSLRRIGIGEDTTFDLTFYATVVGIVMARVGYIVFHSDVFTGKSVLLYFTLWVAPGLSWTGALVGALATIVLLSRQYKIRLGQVLDALVGALPLTFILGAVGTFFDGAQVGKVSQLPWAIALSNVEGLRHPIELYQMVGVLLLGIIYMRASVIGNIKKWSYGIVSIWFIFWYSCMMFMLEFAKDSRVYFGNITVNQWVYVALIAECIGVLYVRGGGREKLRPLFRLIVLRCKNIGERIYATISKRRA